MPIDIHGKQYLTVVERMDKLLDECGKEGYSLDTEVNVVNDKCIVKATLTLFFLKDVKGEPVPLTRTYTGHAVGSIEHNLSYVATSTNSESLSNRSSSLFINSPSSKSSLLSFSLLSMFCGGGCCR